MVFPPLWRVTELTEEHVKNTIVIADEVAKQTTDAAPNVRRIFLKIA